MKPESFEVHCLPITNWHDRDVWYFVKYRNKYNYMFRPKLGIQKFYTIGKWWTNKDGTPRTRESIEKEIQRYAIVRQRLEQSEKFIVVKRQAADWEYPTNHERLKETLENEEDTVLYDWFSILREKPTLFNTSPPNWLIDEIQSQPLKCIDLLDALYARLRNTANKDIIYAFQIYHNHDLR
jgi:hypothetical protein